MSNPSRFDGPLSAALPVPDVHEHFGRFPYHAPSHNTTMAAMRDALNMTAPSRIIPLSEVLKNAEAQMCSLRAAVHELAGLLTPFLAPPAPVENPAPVDPSMPFTAQSPTGEVVLAHTYSLLHLTEDIKRLTARLDTAT